MGNVSIYIRKVSLIIKKLNFFFIEFSLLTNQELLLIKSVQIPHTFLTFTALTQRKWMFVSNICNCFYSLVIQAA